MAAGALSPALDRAVYCGLCRGGADGAGGKEPVPPGASPQRGGHDDEPCGAVAGFSSGGVAQLPGHIRPDGLCRLRAGVG